MNSNKCNSEIAVLKANQINYKIKNVDGYIVKISSLSANVELSYDRSRKNQVKCKRTGLKYTYYNCLPKNTCYIFTECPIYNNMDMNEVNAKKDCIVVTIYQSPQDFMYSSLAEYFRDNTIGNENSFFWDKHGYFRTDSDEYNGLSIVIAISKLRVDKTIITKPPKRIRPKRGFQI